MHHVMRGLDPRIQASRFQFRGPASSSVFDPGGDVANEFEPVKVSIVQAL